MISFRNVFYSIVLLVVQVGWQVDVGAADNFRDDAQAVRIGWIGALTGPTAKWGAQQAAILAEEEVNSSGGIKGRPLKLIFEDTGCNGAKAISAFQKLSSANISFLLGGHCSPDTLAFAPIAERKKILTIAAITSSPNLTNAGDYIFRVTPVSTRLADLLVPYARKRLDVKRLAIVHELTDYVVPVAERVRSTFESNGGTVTDVVSFNSGEGDFRSILIKVSGKKPDAIYFGVQAPDTGMILAKQTRELGLQTIILGNEQFGGAFLSSDLTERKMLEGIVFAQPKCDTEAPAVKSFIEKYTRRNQVKVVPFGCYTAEAYDSVKILASAIESCGENVPCVKQFLYAMRRYAGASGKISFDLNGDVDKEYVLQIIKDGQIKALE